MRFKKQFEEFTPDFEVNEADYIVDDSGYESLPDLLARCIRDARPLPEHSVGLVEDVEIGDKFVYDDASDAALFPEDYIDNPQPVQAEDRLSNNISEQAEQVSPAKVEIKKDDSLAN